MIRFRARVVLFSKDYKEATLPTPEWVGNYRSYGATLLRTSFTDAGCYLSMIRSQANYSLGGPNSAMRMLTGLSIKHQVPIELTVAGSINGQEDTERLKRYYGVFGFRVISGNDMIFEPN
jgi:hypothetical protein